MAIMTRRSTQGLASDPSYWAKAITKSDSVDFAEGVCSAIYVGGDGDIVAIAGDGTAVTFVGCKAGTIIPFQAKRVNSTSTTATSMVALY